MAAASATCGPGKADADASGTSAGADGASASAAAIVDPIGVGDGSDSDSGQITAEAEATQAGVGLGAASSSASANPGAEASQELDCRVADLGIDLIGSSSETLSPSAPTKTSASDGVTHIRWVADALPRVECKVDSTLPEMKRSYQGQFFTDTDERQLRLLGSLETPESMREIEIQVGPELVFDGRTFETGSAPQDLSSTPYTLQVDLTVDHERHAYRCDGVVSSA